MKTVITDTQIDGLLNMLKSQADWYGWERSQDILRQRVRDWLKTIKPARKARKRAAK